MVTKKPMLVLFAVSAVIVLSGCASRTKGKPVDIQGGDPGGPIIVIRPEPEPTLEVASQCKTPPCWYAGSPSISHWSHLPNEVNWVKDSKGARTPAFWEGVRCIGITTASDKSLSCDVSTGTDGFDHYERVTLVLDEGGGKTSDLVIETGFAPNFFYPSKGAELYTVWGRKHGQWPPELKKQILSVTAYEKRTDKVGKSIDLTKDVQIHLY